MKNLKSNLAQNLFNEVLNGKKGNTFDFNGNEVSFNTGYFAGIKGFNLPKVFLINTKYPINTLHDYLLSFPIQQSFSFVGYWIENDILYIDFVEYFDSLDAAKYAGKLYGQKAIFDCKNNTEIYI
jgi:hypothetical protein